MHNVCELLWYWLLTFEDFTCISCVRSLELRLSIHSCSLWSTELGWRDAGHSTGYYQGRNCFSFLAQLSFEVSGQNFPTFLCSFVKGQICETEGGICICGQVDVDRLLNSQLGAREREIVRLHYGVGCHDGNRMSLETISHRPAFFFSLSVYWSVLISMLSCSLEVRTHWRKKLEYSGVSK